MRRIIQAVEEPIEKRALRAALEKINRILKGEGVAQFASLLYVKRDLSTRATVLFDLDTHQWLFECSLLAMFSMSTRLRRALHRAAAEAYHREVIETEMQDVIIGEGKDYSSRDEWIELQIDSWLRQK